MKRLLNTNIVFPLGYFPITFLAIVYSQWFIYVHVQEQGSPSEIHPAWILATAYFLQAILSPITGHLSDRLFHWAGSRKPLLIIASPLLAFCFFHLWSPNLNLIMVLIYSFVYMFTTQTYLSLLPRLTSNGHYRTLLAMLGSLVAMAATVAALSLAPYCITHYSITTLAWCGALFTLLGLIPPSAIYRVDPQMQFEASFPHKKQSLREIGTTLYRSGFWRFLLANFFIYTCSVALTMMSPFFVVDIIGLPKDYFLIMNISIALGMILGVLLLTLLQRRFGTIQLYQWMVIMELMVLTAGALKLQQVVLFDGLPWPMIFFATGVFMISTMSLPPLIIAQFIDRIKSKSDATLFALNGSAINLGSCFAALSMAIFALTRPQTEVFSLSALIALGLILYIFLFVSIVQLSRTTNQLFRYESCQTTVN